MVDGVSSAEKYRERYHLICETLREDPLEEIKKSGVSYLNRNKISSMLTVLVSTLSLDEYFEAGGNPPHCFAGYSIGQWTALFAAGAVSFESLIRIIDKRSEFMDSCFSDEEGAMMAVIGVREEALQSHLASLRDLGHSIWISNANCPGQYSIAGTKRAVTLALESIESLKPKKATILPVEGAWHCALLASAEKRFLEYLQDVEISRPRIPVIDNCTGDFLPDDRDAMKAGLARHISHPVLWEQGIRRLIREGCTDFVEIGFGTILTKFGFFIDRDLEHRSFYAKS